MSAWSWFTHWGYVFLTKCQCPVTRIQRHGKHSLCSEKRGIHFLYILAEKNDWGRVQTAGLATCGEEQSWVSKIHMPATARMNSCVSWGSSLSWLLSSLDAWRQQHTIKKGIIFNHAIIYHSWKIECKKKMLEGGGKGTKHNITDYCLRLLVHLGLGHYKPEQNYIELNNTSGLWCETETVPKFSHLALSSGGLLGLCFKEAACNMF